MDRSRRDVLRYVGPGFALLAGCLGESTPADDRTASDAPTAERHEYSVTVRRTVVTPELVASNSPDSVATFGERDEQYLLGRVVVGGATGPVYRSFALDTGEETYGATTEGSYHGSLWNRGRLYEYERDVGWVVFRVPKPLDARRAAVMWPSGESALDDETRARLTRPPTRFVVRSFSASPSASGATVTLTVRVSNVGDVDGTFVGALNRVGGTYAGEAAVRLDVAAGETATWEGECELDALTESASDATVQGSFQLGWRDGSASQSVDVSTE